MDRLIDQFPADRQAQVRTMLSVSLRGVIAQALLPTKDGKGRVAAFEIMVMTAAIAHLIRENKTHRITSEIQTGGKHGMILLDDHLFKLFKEKKIRYADMMEVSAAPADLQKRIREEGLVGKGTRPGGGPPRPPMAKSKR